MFIEMQLDSGEGRPIQYLDCDVLVVDDDPAIRRLLAAVFEDEGCSVRMASDGDVALSLCAEQLPRLMLLDLNMPNMDGYEVLSELDTRGWRQFPVLVVTGNSRLAELRDRVDGVVPKPVDIDDLVYRARDLLEAHADSNG